MTPRHGLVIGKFYPPHAGHHLLVQTAAACCERVTVVVMAAAVESIPLEARVAWLRELHGERGVTVVGTRDDHPVDLESDTAWSAHVALMQEAAAQVSSVPVDAVFTSEAYGEELARRLGARHVAVDAARTLVPISATRVRADPVGAWEYLSAPVRAWLARRVVVVGAESTGKTTLATELADRLRQRGGSHGFGADLLARFQRHERSGRPLRPYQSSRGLRRRQRPVDRAGRLVLVAGPAGVA